MKCYFTFLSLFLSFSFIHAQNPYPKEELALLALERKLVVELLNETSDTKKHQNEAIKQIFVDDWNLTEVEFLTIKEIEILKKRKDESYVFLTQSESLREDVRSGYITKDGRINRVGYTPDGTRFNYVAFTFAYYDFSVDVFLKGKMKNVTKIGFSNGELTKIDYLYLSQQLTRLLQSSSKGIESKDFYNVEQNIDELKNTKLILLEDLFIEKDRKSISSFYKYDYELVNYEKYQDVILNKLNDYSYVKIIWSNHHKMYMWVTVNSENGNINSITSFGGVKFGMHHDANDIIKVKHLKYPTNIKGQALNSRY